jgi:hypothetical protein
MTIYSNSDYRKIYESHFGPIPKDEFGRRYHIHHIDGNRNNNDISNLKCVSIQEHYDIHHAQGDWAACLLLSTSMKLSAETISENARKNNLKQVINKTHPWQNKEKARQRELKKVDDGVHPFVGGELSRKRVLEGTHNFLKRKDGSSAQTDRVNSKTHHLLTRPDGTSVTSDKVRNGTHNWLGSSHNENRLKNGNHPSQNKESIAKISEKAKERVKKGTHNFSSKSSPNYIRVCCVCCKKETSLPSLGGFHGSSKCAR